MRRAGQHFAWRQIWRIFLSQEWNNYPDRVNLSDWDNLSQFGDKEYLSQGLGEDRESWTRGIETQWPCDWLFFLPIEFNQGCPTFFPLEHDWKMLEHQGLKPSASLRPEAPKGGGLRRGSPPPTGEGRGGLPQEFFGKLPQKGAFWCILKQ